MLYHAKIKYPSSSSDWTDNALITADDRQAAKAYLKYKFEEAQTKYVLVSLRKITEEQGYEIEATNPLDWR